MIDEISGAGRERTDPLAAGRRARVRRAGGRADAAEGTEAPEVVVSSELSELIRRVKLADVVRKDRVHQVLEKLQRGELVTSETVREAAENILGTEF